MRSIGLCCTVCRKVIWLEVETARDFAIDSEGVRVTGLIPPYWCTWHRIDPPGSDVRKIETALESKPSAICLRLWLAEQSSHISLNQTHRSSTSFSEPSACWLEEWTNGQKKLTFKAVFLVLLLTRKQSEQADNQYIHFWSEARVSPQKRWKCIGLCFKCSREAVQQMELWETIVDDFTTWFFFFKF